MLVQPAFSFVPMTINCFNKKQLNDMTPKTPSNNTSYLFSNFCTNKVYAQTMPNFKSSNINRTNFEFILTDEQKAPRVRVEINKNNSFDTKPGVYPIYQMALNDQMCEELLKNPDIKDNNSFILPESRRLDIRCSQEDLLSVLTMVKNSFIDLKISPKHFNTAKSLAPLAYEIDRATKEFSADFSDVPKEMKNDEYSDLVNKISYQDVLNYNKDILNNSDKNIQLFVNRDFYEEHKTEINGIINKWV